MATRTITTKLALEGEAEYRAQLQKINAELRLHQSALEKVTAQYAEKANGLDALRAKKTALANQVEAVTQKTALYNAMLEKAKAAQFDCEVTAGALKNRLEALKSTAGDTAEEEARLAAELAETEANLQKAANSVTAYQTAVNNSTRDQKTLERELAETRKYLDEAERSWKKCAVSIDDLGQKTGKSGSTIKQFAGVFDQLEGPAKVRAVAAAFKECLDASMAYESAFAGVRKTVEGTEEQLAAISDGIKEMATEIPASTTEIAGVAEAAGQLGIATEDVLSFTRVMLDLGESTDLTAEEAATALARFANVTGTAAED